MTVTTKSPLSPEDIDGMSPLAWAYMGDAVYEQLARTAVCRPFLKPQKLHRLAAKIVSARGQTAFYHAVAPILTEEEETVFRRGRNAHSHTMAKNMTVREYRTATGVEALFGYLYLHGRHSRLEELFDHGLEVLNR